MAATFIAPDELLANLYFDDGTPNALTAFRLTFGDGWDDLTPAQRRRVKEARALAERLAREALLENPDLTPAQRRRAEEAPDY